MLQLRQRKGYKLPTSVMDSQCLPGHVCTNAPISGSHKIGTLNGMIWISFLGILAKTLLKARRERAKLVPCCGTIVLSKGCGKSGNFCFPQILLNKKETWPLEDYTNSWIHLEEDILMYVHRGKISRNKEQRTPRSDCRQPIIRQLATQLQRSIQLCVACAYASWDSADWTF